MNRAERRALAKERKKSANAGVARAKDASSASASEDEDAEVEVEVEVDRRASGAGTTTARRRRGNVERSDGAKRATRASDNGAEGGFLAKISWTHIFFLFLFVAPTAFVCLDYVFNITPPPGRAYGTLTPEGRMYRDKIKAFYSEYAPEKATAANMEKLMVAYKGRERALYNTIRKKYAREKRKRHDQRYDD